jgi:hypothetical protein
MLAAASSLASLGAVCAVTLDRGPAGGSSRRWARYTGQRRTAGRMRPLTTLTARYAPNVGTGPAAPADEVECDIRG